MPLRTTRAQSTDSQEQVQHQNANDTQNRDQQLPYCTNVGGTETDNHSASVLTGRLEGIVLHSDSPGCEQGKVLNLVLVHVERECPCGQLPVESVWFPYRLY